MYTVLFAVCMFVLFVKFKKSAQPVFTVAAVVMYAIATADIGLSFHFVFHYLLSDASVVSRRHLLPKVVLYVTNK